MATRRRLTNKAASAVGEKRTLSHSSASISAVKPMPAPKSIQHLQSALTLSASRRAESSWIPVRTNFEAMQLSVMPRRSSSERRRAEARPIKRPGAHRGTLANTTSRTPPAHRAKGVKDLHVPGRRPPIATERVRRAAVLSNQRRSLETTSAPCPRSVLSLSPTAQTGGACPRENKKPPGVSPAVGGIIGRKRPIGRERDRETPQHEESISHCSNLQGEHGVTFL